MAIAESLKPETVRPLIEAQFPQLSPAHVAYLGEGCDSVAFEINGDWVFRFPKRADVAQQLLTEMRILPRLAERLPVPVPAYCFHGKPSEDSPFHYGGYPKLAGVPAILLAPGAIPSSSVGASVGCFLSALHAFPAGLAASLGVPSQETGQMIEDARAEALDGFGLVRQEAPDAPLDRWRAYLAAGLSEAAMRLLTPRVVHNDLAAEHVLCDPIARAVTGVIDWSDVAIGDAAADFAGMFHWGGEELAAAVLSHYREQIDDGLRTRARFLAACRGVTDVCFGIDRGRREYVVAGIRALELCAHGQ